MSTARSEIELPPEPVNRASGVLLHPTSLPGPDGIGDLGPGASAWLKWLGEAGCRWWQVLPLGPTGYGDSPYQSGSSFAGNPLLISLDLAREDGLLREQDFERRPSFPGDRVEYGAVIAHKDGMLRLAARRFVEGGAPGLEAEFRRFCRAQGDWLEDYALFSALKRAHGGAAWVEWPEPLARRRTPAIRRAAEQAKAEVEAEKFLQFVFARQWAGVRREAAARGITLVGDVPIFVAHDSADVWANRGLFRLDRSGHPTVVAGVPPDVFTATGQRWGNPLYRWRVLRDDRYSWWVARLRSTLEKVDRVRLDHFLGFHAYWEVPAHSATAAIGRWVPGPGAHLFDRLKRALGELPIIAEDLGVITPGVIALRERFDLPGMKILQFAFGAGADHEFLPHNYPRRCVVYTGTHDNDTARGWYESAPEAERDRCRRYLGVDGHDIAWDLIRAAWASVAEAAVAPLQDVLSLGSEARMNLPGRADGNWRWRVQPHQLTSELAGRLRELNSLYGRVASAQVPDL